MIKRTPKSPGGALDPRQMNSKKGENRLLWKAVAVLELAVQLRGTSSVPDLNALRERIVAILFDFQEQARAAGIEPTRIGQAAEILAALIDHAVTSMPWGADAGWQSVSLSDGLSGARVQKPRLFTPAQRLLAIARASASDADMRELINVAVLLGFDKRSRGADAASIELAELAANESTSSEQRLSPEWQSAVARRRALSSWLPLWVSTCVGAALLAVLFFVLELSLGARSDQVYARVAALERPLSTSERPQPASSPRLAAALSRETTGSNLFVRDEVDRSRVIIPETRLFESGEARLRADSADLLHSVSRALQLFPGRIQVVGHTDRNTARSARYPSDWDLSVDRARAVQQALTGLHATTCQITYDGRGSIEPLPINDAARAVSGDGRVEIILLVGR